MSLWAKLTGNPAFPSDEKTSSNTKYFYSSTSGQIISADGSGYVLPNLDKLPSDKEEFIPQKEALKKIQELVVTTQSNQQLYDQNIHKLNSYYESMLEGSKFHYETIIQDLKSKAKRHIEVQREMKKQQESILMKELKQNEETIDEMRDSMAALNRKYQDEVRALKKQLFDTEILLKSSKNRQEKQNITFSNQFLLQEIVSKIEDNYHKDELTSIASQFDKEKSRLQSSFESSLFSQTVQMDSLKSKYKYDKLVREECQDALLNILVKLEIEDLFEKEAKMEILAGNLQKAMDENANLSNITEKQSQTIQNLKTKEESLQGDNITKQEEIAQLLYDFTVEKEKIMTQHQEETSYHATQFQQQLQKLQAEIDRLDVEMIMEKLTSNICNEEHDNFRSQHIIILGKLKDEFQLVSQQSNLSTEEQFKNQEIRHQLALQEEINQLEKAKGELLATHQQDINDIEEKFRKQLKDSTVKFQTTFSDMKIKLENNLKTVEQIHNMSEVSLAMEKILGGVLEKQLIEMKSKEIILPEAKSTGTMTDKIIAEDRQVNTDESLLPTVVVKEVVSETVVKKPENVDACVNTDIRGEITEVKTQLDQQSAYGKNSNAERESMLSELLSLRAQLELAHQNINKISSSTAQSNISVPTSDYPIKEAQIENNEHVSSISESNNTPVINPELVQCINDILDAENKINTLKQQQTNLKQEIKDWTRDFQIQNNRAPEVSDKALIRDKYQRYKDVTTALKDAETKTKQLQTKKEELESLPPTKLSPSVSIAKLVPAASSTKLSVVASEVPEKESANSPGRVVSDAPNRPTTAKERKEVKNAAVQVELSPSIVEVPTPIPFAQPEPEVDKGPTIDDVQKQHAIEVEKLTQQYDQMLEQLEDNLFQHKEEIQSLLKQHQTVMSEKAFLETQLEILIKEKRTDVIARYEEDIKNLKRKEAELNEKVTTLNTEKVKNETKISELKDRSDKAELELRERDARELKVLNPQEEAYKLKGEINKQRDQIIMKSKAATAGWDAAANADEKLDLEMQKAFSRGMREEKERHSQDLVAVNASLEKKETRITELLVSMAEMEKKVKASEMDQVNMRAQMEAMKLEVADAITGIQQMAAATSGNATTMTNEDGEVVIPPTNAEVDALREQLDLSQEELVSITERCERIEQELELARKRNRIYERLATMTGLTSGEAASVGGATGGNKGDYGKYNIDEAISIVKKAIVKGTNLWKSNKKDDCYDVYLDACVDAGGKILTEELAKPLRDSIEHGKGQGIQSKQRGAVVFRKALDKFLADSGQPSIRQNEELAVAAGKSKVETSNASQNAANNTVVQSLMIQLTNMDNLFLEQGYTAEKNPANSSSGGTAERTPRDNNDSGAANSSLLQRAKLAEQQAKSLKKQLAAVISAASAQAQQGQVVTSEDGGALTTTAGDDATGISGTSSRIVKVVAGAGGADPGEVRRLNRKIKDLEQQLKTASTATTTNASGGDNKATQQIEKQLNKKIKDLENQLKKDTKTLEQRAVKAENALAKIEGNQKGIVVERDQLKAENARLFGITSEINTLKAKAELCEEVQAKLSVKEEEYLVLSEQFKKETQLRKKYKNELEDLKGAIRVYARCRPMARYEIEKGCKSVVDLVSETTMKVTTGRGEKEFEFDCVFGPRSTQDEIFEDTKRLVESCLDGFNVCVFAYGQTGSGKTFTMTGSPSLPGLTPKAISELFRLMDERKHLQIKVSTYFVELYNENLVDLYWILDNKKNSNVDPPKLEIKMDNKKMVFIRNCVIKEVFSPYELMEFFEKGNAERHTGATKMNAESSRSHSIFSLLVESFDTTTKRTTFGKLSLVDLAGSERADKTGASAERLREAQSINKSLSALGDVIAALSEGGANKFIPYRNNKLTQLMQDSLGGNAKTLMFVNFSPADYNADETSTSLMYASRVKKIVNNASKQAESEEVARLKSIIKRLQTGQPIADLEPPEPVIDEPEPIAEDDGKAYDGY